MATLGSFSANYGPGLQTESNMNLSGPMGGGGGYSADSMLNRLLNLKGRQRARDQVAALGQMSPSPAQVISPERRFWNNKRDFDYILSKDPWAARSHGQATGLSYFNMPAAAALTFGRDIFPNGFDTYSDILRSGGGVAPEAQARQGQAAGQAATWGQGF